MLAGGLILLPIGLAQQPDPGSFSGASLAAFAYLVVFGSLVGFTAYVWLLHHVPLGTASTYAYVNPVVAIALGVLFLDERLTWQILVGAAIVLASSPSSSAGSPRPRSSRSRSDRSPLHDPIQSSVTAPGNAPIASPGAAAPRRRCAPRPRSPA